MKKEKAALLAALLVGAFSAQAQVTINVNNNLNGETRTWTVTDLNSPSVSGDGSPQISGLFEAAGQLDAAAQIQFNFKAANDCTNTAAAAAIAAETFGTYVAGLNTSGNILDGVQLTWGINSTANGGDSDNTRISDNEAFIIEVSTSGFTNDLIIQDFFWGNESLNDRCDIFIYDASENTVVQALDNARPSSFGGNYPVNNGDIILIGNRAEVYRWDKIVFDIKSTATGVIPPAGVEAISSNSLVTVNWLADTSGTLDYYNVYRRTDTNAAYSGTPYATGITTNTFADFSVINGTNYYYVITAVDGVPFETDPSEEVSVTPAIPVPTGLIAEAGNGEVVLDWDDSIDYLFDSFVVYRSTTSGSGLEAIESNLVDSAYTDTTVINELTYYYAIAQRDTNGSESEPGATVSAMPTPALIVVSPKTQLQAETRANADYGTGTYTSNGTSVVTGGIRAGEFGISGANAAITRAVVKFPLSVADLGDKTVDDIEKVWLEMYVFQNTLSGAPAGTQVEVYASQTESANANVAAGDFQNAAYTKIGNWTDIATNSPANQYYTLDVTGVVTNDLLTDVQDATAGTCLRLQLTDDLSFNPTNNADTGGIIAVRFNDDAADNPPLLRIEFKDGRELYVQWTDQWLPADLSDAAGDHDNDGLSNLYEYGLDGNPTNGTQDPAVLPVFGNDGSGFNYIVPQRSDDDALVYRVETTGSLTVPAWTNLGYTVSGIHVTGETMNFVTNAVESVEDQKFIRLIIE